MLSVIATQHRGDRRTVATASSILYVGRNAGTSRQRLLALRRLGHTVSVIDPRQFLPPGRPVDYWIYHTGALFLGHWIRRQVIHALGSSQFDVAFINHGELVNASLVEDLSRLCSYVINYNVDDPFGGRDGAKWRLYLEAVPAYDAVVVTRDCNVAEAYSAGARNVLRVSRSADEVAHAPRQISEEDMCRWHADVVFIGTWMPERGPLLAKLIGLNVPLTIYGDHWQKAPEWPLLRSHWNGPGLYRDDDYARAVQCAKVCLGLLSKGNRDLVTQRSFEIPYLGGVLCAERTREHLTYYREDVDAIFWSDAEECAEKCHRLLADHKWRESVAESGRARCLANRTTNENVLTDILEHLRASAHSARNPRAFQR